jgi:hypothetical protein
VRVLSKNIALVYYVREWKKERRVDAGIKLYFFTLAESMYKYLQIIKLPVINNTHITTDNFTVQYRKFKDKVYESSQ